MNILRINKIFAVITVLVIVISLIITFIKARKENPIDEKKVGILKNKYVYITIFVIMIILAIFTRIYKIDVLLNGLHADEAGMGYDAYCIANYGVDRFLNKLPVYMINFGGGQSALYTYLAAIIVKLMGLSILSIRLPGIILSLLAIIFGYILVKKTKNKYGALVFMFLMIICPWHVMQSRFGLDCNLLSSMIIISLSCLLNSKKWWQYLITGILFGVTLYTYALSYLILPIFLLLIFAYMLLIKKITFKYITITMIPIVILAIPLILMILINNGYMEEINSFITIPKIYNYRVGEIGTKNIISNLKVMKEIFTSDKFIYNSIPEFGTIYLFAIPLLILGLIIALVNTIKKLKERNFTLDTIMLILFITNIIVMSLTKTNVNKINSIFIPALYFVTISIMYIYKKFRIGSFIILIIYIIMSILFFNYYYNYYNNDYNNIDLVNNQLVDLAAEIQKIDTKKNVYMNLCATQPWIYFAYSLEESPYKLNTTKHDDTVDYWTNMVSFDRYYFGLPKEMDFNGIYVIKLDSDTENLIEELNKNNYTNEIYGNYKIYYKED